MGYSKAPEQPQSSTRPICHSHAMTNTGREPATINYALLHRSSPRYALRHGRRAWSLVYVHNALTGMRKFAFKPSDLACPLIFW